MAQEPSGRHGPATVSWYASNRKGMNMETFEQHVKKVVATELDVNQADLTNYAHASQCPVRATASF